LDGSDLRTRRLRRERCTGGIGRHDDCRQRYNDGGDRQLPSDIVEHGRDDVVDGGIRNGELFVRHRARGELGR